MSTKVDAQTISVSSFKMLETDLTANTAGTMETDQNGETAALIKVVTTQTGFTFDGGALGIVKTVQKPSEVWVYVPRGLKKITISHPQLGMLRDYYLNIPIEAARTYEMVLVAGEVQTIVKQARTSQYVVFQLVPPDAVVELNGELLKTEGGVASKMMKFGTYNYRVQAPDYLLEAGSVTIDDPDNKKIVNISLKPNFAQVSIKVDNNAEIWINGDKKGVGSWTGNLGAGTYEIEAKKAGHRSTLLTKDIEVTQEPQNISLQTPTPIYGEANINSTPGMADIIIDGEKVGQTPLLVSNILIGKHSVTIEKNGYENDTKAIEIQEDAICDLNINLKKRDIIKEEPKNVAKGNQNNNKVGELISLGRRCLDNKDPKGALSYAEKANAAAKHKSAEAFILLGDIEATYGTDGGKAAGFYNQAITFDPKNPEGYKKWAMVYRKISPSQAAQKLQEMKVNCPDEDVDGFTGHMYMLVNDEKNAYESYKKADVAKLDRQGLNEFARCSFFGGHFDDALKAAEAGLKLEPRNPTFNRLAMFSNYELKNYEVAKQYAQKYFYEIGFNEYSEYDHFYAALIYQALGEKSKVYDHYNKCLVLCNSGESLIKKWAVLKSLSDSYLHDNDYENSVKYYKDFLACKPELNSDDMEGLAKIYSKYADADEARKAELVAKAVEAYHVMGEKFPIQKIYAAYQCATMNNKLDKTGEKGLAKPEYQKVVELLEGKADRDNSENTMLKYSYHYLMSNAFLYGKNKALAKEYANKILTIDPDYAPAQQIRDLK